MQDTQRIYIAIDLKSFYASVECVERGLDALTTNLVVADSSRTDKTICLAVSPPLKEYGISGRARLFEVVRRVREVNEERRRNAPNGRLEGKSASAIEIKDNPALEVDYIVAVPRMAHYIKRSAQIYGIYLKYIAPEDIHVYSIDEVFIDATAYLKSYKTTAQELTKKMILDVLRTTGITATAGIGTNMYLCKIAMDIMAKHIEPDKDGVLMAFLDEKLYREQLWEHRPLTDFWRVGRGIARKIEAHGLFTMGDIALQSVYNEDLLYSLFGVNAELLIDHAWGWEPCTMSLIKAYKPESNCLSSGQVLSEPYTAKKAKVVIREMADALAMELTEKHCTTNQLTLTVSYDPGNISNSNDTYDGETHIDHYGRKVPKHAHGTANLKEQTSSSKIISEAATSLYDRIINRSLLVRRINICANQVVAEGKTEDFSTARELDLFADCETENTESTEALAKEKLMQETILKIKGRFGKNSILKGLNFDEGATAKQRNEQIGGHRA